MNKDKLKLNYKKTMIRNTEQPKPKTVVIEEGISDDLNRCTLTENPGEDREVRNQKSLFESPELNSVLRISRKIESIENIKPRKVKSVSDLDKKNKLVVDERASKQVNFPYDRPIYKDLIPLCVRTEPQPLPKISREILRKDIEPSLSDFFTPNRLPEYSFEAPVHIKEKPVTQLYAGLKLYRIMRSWN